jgi:hypothetical protein
VTLDKTCESNQVPGNYNYTLDVSSYKPGFYFVRLETKNGTYTQKIVKTQ